jgi:hypothetical protein
MGTGDVLLLAGMVMVVTAFVPLFLIFRYEYRERLRSEKSSRNDLANMMILLQTMRDLVGEQRDLARQLNESVDRRVKEIRALAKEVRQHQGQIVPPESGSISKSVSDRALEPLEPLSAPVSHVSPVEANWRSDGESDLIDSWSGLDFGGDEPDPSVVAQQSHKQPPREKRSAPAVLPPESPEDAEAARAAFRKLMSLQDQPEPAAAELRVPARNGGNGRGDVSPIQQRVYEYSDAGMSVSQIAHELGMGKGEVRLMISLRKSRQA